ncbi:alpha/beta-hydrolase [Testicularia cyperi]|uniref:sn-1-specific diacylglycerol lipase n=1 Tax=Testicularia cyperi TaxID=1882483 RepID=A0A317XT55_9BASI|nr:alpha/beta-hydrolase [Testicularia cyperi]
MDDTLTLPTAEPSVEHSNAPENAATTAVAPTPIEGVTTTEVATLSAAQREEEEKEEREEAESLNEAALSIPDSEASDPPSEVGQAVAQVGNPGTVVSSGPGIDWEGVLGHSASGLGAANAATSAYFSFARTATAFGLNVAKRVTQGLVAVPAFLADGALTGTVPGGNEPSISRVAHSSIAGFFDTISLVATGGIDLTSAITSAGLGAAGSGVEGVRRALGSEVLRSLAEFSKLVQREWNAEDESLPPGGIPAYSIIGVTKALSTWISIQLVTRKFQEQRMLQGLDEIDTAKLREDVEALKRSHHVEVPQTAVATTNGTHQPDGRDSTANSNADVRITSTQPMQGFDGNVIGAEIGHKQGNSSRLPGSTSSDEPSKPLTDAEAIHNLQRYSKLVLGVYGGMALYWLKGVPQVPAEQPASQAQPASTGSSVVFSAEDEFMRRDQAEFLEAASMMELEDEEVDASERDQPSTAAPASAQPHPSSYKLWDVISGTHDNDLFHHTANLERGAAAEGQYVEERVPPSRSASVTSEKAKPSKPRFYVVTDHPRKTIILVLRGTLSMGDVAADLTCESVPFVFSPTVAANLSKRESENRKGTISATSSRRLFVDEKAEDLCHEGMYITAQEIGAQGRSVHRSVAAALAANEGYSLDISGHSLGAGVASVLAMMWADPTTGLTVAESGLPAGRRLHAYCFAVPCVTNEVLGRKVTSIITSHTFSYDLVCRLSLGSIQDIRNASAWLCYQDQQAGHGPETMNALMKRAFEYQSGRIDPDAAVELESEFLVLRKTLEANMHNTHLFPPGKVLYSLRQGSDLLPPQSSSPSNAGAEDSASAERQVSTTTVPQHETGAHRLFRVKDRAGALNNVFGQIIFSRNMLSSHMPNVYDDMLHSLAH